MEANNGGGLSKDSYVSLEEEKGAARKDRSKSAQDPGLQEEHPQYLRSKNPSYAAAMDNEDRESTSNASTSQQRRPRMPSQQQQQQQQRPEPLEKHYLSLPLQDYEQNDRDVEDQYRRGLYEAAEPMHRGGRNAILATTFHQVPHIVRRLSNASMRDHDFSLPNFVRRLSSAGVPYATSLGLRGHKHSDIGAGDSVLRGGGDDEDDNHSLEAKSFISRLDRKNKVKKRTRRVCDKDGSANVKYRNVSEKRRRYIWDLYTTLVDAEWRTCLFLFAASFYITWVSYAVVYYLICYLHGDFLTENSSNPDYVPCVLELDGFAAAFLFSLETQHTIGYGSRQTTTECVEAMIVMSTQSVLGCLIQAFMVGLVFAKLSTPNRRAKTIVFSKNAVICERDRKLCLIFRVGDMRPDSFIVGAQLSAKLIRRKVTQEGEMFHDVEPFSITPDSSSEPCVFLIWPITLTHVIDKESPFYHLTAQELATDNFEIHLVLEGTIEASGMTFQARSSYLPKEILWGHRFEPMMIYRKDHNKYQINYSAFNSTYEVDTPLCSAADLQRHYKARANYERGSAAAAAPGVGLSHSSTMPPLLVTGPTPRGSHTNMSNIQAGIEAEHRAEARAMDSVSDWGSKKEDVSTESNSDDEAKIENEEGLRMS